MINAFHIRELKNHVNNKERKIKLSLSLISWYLMFFWDNLNNNNNSSSEKTWHQHSVSRNRKSRRQMPFDGHPTKVVFSLPYTVFKSAQNWRNFKIKLFYYIYLYI